MVMLIMVGGLRMNNTIHLKLILLIFIIFSRCAEPPTYKGEIKDIFFGTGWDPNEENISGIKYEFPQGTKVVYYSFILDEIGFNTLVRKTWKRDGSTLFSATTYVAEGTNRVSGELHFYDNSNLPSGIYQIIIECYDVVEGKGAWKKIPLTPQAEA